MPASGPVEVQFGQDLDVAVEVGINNFRIRNDYETTMLQLYDKLKKEGFPDAKTKTTWTPWLTTVRRQMKSAGQAFQYKLQNFSRTHGPSHSLVNDVPWVDMVMFFL